MRTVVLVVTFERFRDIWEIQAESLDKFWPGRPETCWLLGGAMPGRDVTVDRRVFFPRHSTVNNWTELVLDGLEKIALADDDCVFLVIGDHFLVAPADEEFLVTKCAWLIGRWKEIHCVRVWPSPGPDKELGYLEFGEIAQDAPYRISTAPAFWRVSYFREIVRRSPPSAWRFELAGSEIAKNDGARLLSVTRERQPCPYPITLGLRNERWTPDSVEACRKAGLDIEASVRLRGIARVGA